MSTRDLSGWVASEVEAMAEAWKRGERCRAEEILSRRPDLDDEAAIRLIYEEVCLRREAAEEVATAEIVGRFPRWKNELEVLLSCDRLLGTAPIVAFPEVGESLGDFHLLADLGRGAAGRTYLAIQPALADRPVALKVAPTDQDEHLNLARLLHASIVPLYSEHLFSERGLRAICMPYLGGASLARLLGEMAEVPVEQRRGADLVRALESAGTLRPGLIPAEGPALGLFEQETYVRSVCWIASCLADGLHYAHERGLVHMDVKPSNILIAADGQPMLLDFHLAHAPIAKDARPSGRLGGTPGWMAPEQKMMFDAMVDGRPIPRPVDARADIYALGLVLREALSDPGAKDSAITARRGGGRHFTVGLADIVRKCLQPDPDARYPSAALVAEDLRRHFEDRPLRGVANRSPRELWRKWQRRHPHVGLRVAAAASLLIAALALLAFTWERRQGRDHEIAAAFKDADRFEQEHRYEEADRVLSQVGPLVSDDVLGSSLARRAERQLRRVRRGMVAEEVHQVANKVRFRGDATANDETLRKQLSSLASIWDRSDLLAAPGDARLGANAEERFRRDVVELAIIWASLCRTSASEVDRRSLAEGALVRLDRLRDQFGASAALDRERKALARYLGRPEPPGEGACDPRSAWEYDLIGRSLVREGRLDEAAERFGRAVALEPGAFWPNFDEGLCALRRGRGDEAVAAFRACIALDPKSPAGYFNRALAYEKLGSSELAFADYDKALRLDRRFAPAALNRGILHFKAGRHSEALEDLRLAIASTPEREILGRAYYNLALVELKRSDRASGSAHLARAVSLGDPDATAFAKAKP